MIIGSSQGRLLTEKLQLQALVTANLPASIFVSLFRLRFHGSEIRLNVATILKGSFQCNRVNKSISSYTYRKVCISEVNHSPAQLLLSHVKPCSLCVQSNMDDLNGRTV